MKPDSKRSRRPARSGWQQLGIALALSATTFGAQAAGLGRLNLMSALGQPLRAEIELTSVAADDAGTLTARLAPPAAFSQAGIEYGSSLAGLRFSIQRRPGGQQYVLVTSNQQLNEPFLDLLVELTWASGRLVREYTVLLDPPETRAAAATSSEPATAVVPATSAAAPTIVRRTPRAAPAPSPSVASGETSAAPTRRAAAPTASSAGDYVVQTGDTALSIARANKPDGASLEQMLAALYRDNPQAFSGNVNRLMAGATLKMPDAPTAQAIDGSEARRIVAQSSNFGSYRGRLAANAAAAPTTRAPGQQASGQLSTQVQDQAAPAASTDRLQLSRPDATRPTSPASASGSGATRPALGAPTPDDLAAKDRELQETRTRLAMLEKNVSDLQELLKLKNQTLADLQKGATTKGPDTPATVVAPPPSAVTPAAPTASTTTPAATPDATTATATTTGPAAAVAPPVPVAAPTPAPAPAKVAPKPATATPAAEPSFFDSLMDNTLLLVALVVLALLIVGYAIFATRRRRMARFEDSIFVDNSVLRANSVFGTTGGQSVDTANSGFHSNFVPVAGALPEHNEVDPVAEADVYIAYGRDAQAEEILKEALRADPSRHAVRLKLLEIYAKRNDGKTFETMASELYAATGGQGEEWRQAAALGATIDPRNPLYAETPVVDVPAPAPVAPMPFTASEFNAAPLNFAVSEIGMRSPTPDPSSPLTTDIDFPRSMARTDPLPRSSIAPAPAPSMDLDFDLGNTNVASGAAATPASPTPAGAADGPIDMTTSTTTAPMADPFTASAFGNADPTARTAVNLPAFRARADQPAAEAPPEATNIAGRDPEGFTASDIFGSSIIADTQPMPIEPPPAPSPPPPARASRNDILGDGQFDKTEPFDASFSSVNLDLDQSDFLGATRSDINSKTDVWQAMATKLDLALAYSDIGDKDGARELLEEVVRNGDPAQADRARHLITDLG